MKLETGCHARTCTLDCPKNCFLGSYVTPSENWVYRFDGIFFFGLKPRMWVQTILECMHGLDHSPSSQIGFEDLQVLFWVVLKSRSSYRPKSKALCDKRKFEKVWSWCFWQLCVGGGTGSSFCWSGFSLCSGTLGCSKRMLKSYSLVSTIWVRLPGFFTCSRSLRWLWNLQGISILGALLRQSCVAFGPGSFVLCWQFGLSDRVVKYLYVVCGWLVIVSEIGNTCSYPVSFIWRA